MELPTTLATARTRDRRARNKASCNIMLSLSRIIVTCMQKL